MIWTMSREICNGFMASWRRNPWAVLLLWLGLSASTVGVVVGFAASSFSLQNLKYRLPGNMANLVYADISITGDGISGDGVPAVATAQWKMPIAGLQKLIGHNLVAGFFIQINGRSVMTPGGEAAATQVIYGGDTALRGGLVSDGLHVAKVAGGVAVNASFATRYKVSAGDNILLNPWTSYRIAVVVGPQQLLDPSPIVYIPAELAPAETDVTAVGLYLPTMAETSDTADDHTALTAAIKQQYKDVIVLLKSGLEEHHSALREYRTVTGLSIGGALLIALVGFVNAGSLISYWVLKRLPGLVIRRTIGAQSAFLWLSLVADNLAIGVSAAVTGGVAVVLLAPLCGFKGQMQYTGVVAGICLMLAGTIIVSTLLARTAFRQEPGVALRRSL